MVHANGDRWAHHAHIMTTYTCVERMTVVWHETMAAGSVGRCHGGRVAASAAGTLRDWRHRQAGERPPPEDLVDVASPRAARCAHARARGVAGRRTDAPGLS